MEWLLISSIDLGLEMMQCKICPQRCGPLSSLILDFCGFDRV